MAKPKTLPAPSEEANAPPDGSATMALFERAQSGDKSCQKELDTLMDHPEGRPRILKLFGNPPAFAERAVLDGAAGKNLLLRGALQRRLADLRAELEGPNPTPIERLLAERAAYCWLIVWRYEEHLASEKEMSYKHADFHQRRIDSAHRRFNSSLRTLVAVRKLALPAVQINIGENQVNVAGET